MRAVCNSKKLGESLARVVRTVLSAEINKLRVVV